LTGSAVTGVEPGSVVLTSVKKCEHDDDIVFRLLETEGQQATAEVRLDESLLGRPAEAVEVDLLEQPVGEWTAETTAEGFRVRLPAHGIASVKVRFE